MNLRLNCSIKYNGIAFYYIIPTIVFPCFCVHVDEATKLETYYSFYDASAKKIDWSANEDKQKKEQEFRYQLHLY